MSGLETFAKEAKSAVARAAEQSRGFGFVSKRGGCDQAFHLAVRTLLPDLFLPGSPSSAQDSRQVVHLEKVQASLAFALHDAKTHKRSLLCLRGRILWIDEFDENTLFLGRGVPVQADLSV